MRTDVLRKIIVRYGYNRFKKFLEQCMVNGLTRKQVKQELDKMFPDLGITKVHNDTVGTWYRRMGLKRSTGEKTYQMARKMDKLMYLLGDKSLKEYLEDMYINNMLSPREMVKIISKEYPEISDVDKNDIWWWLKFCEIPRRDQSEASRLVWSKQEMRERMSKIITNYYKNNPDMKKHLSEKTKELWKDPEFVEKNLGKRDYLRSSIELKVEEMLKSLGIKFNSHVPVPLHRDFFCIPDLMLENNLLIECQGEYWHGLNGAKDQISKKNKKKDVMKYNPLKSKGYKILYLWEPDINNHPKKCEILIKKFVNGELEHDFHSVNYDENGNYCKKYDFPYGCS